MNVTSDKNMVKFIIISHPPEFFLLHQKIGVSEKFSCPKL